MKKIKNSKGFTLMEMLIVVAIIAVLIAIAVPTFSASLNKARVATDEANIRSGYASVVADLLTKDRSAETGATTTTYTYYLMKDGSVAEATAGDKDYKTLGNNTTAVMISGVSAGTWTKGKGVIYTVTAQPDGSFEIGINADGTTPGQGG